MSRALRHFSVLAYAFVFAVGCKLPKRRADAGAASVILSETYHGKGSLVNLHYPADFAAKSEPIGDATSGALVVLSRALPGGLDEALSVVSVNTPVSNEVKEFARAAHKGAIDGYKSSGKYVEGTQTNDVPMAGTAATCIDGSFTSGLFTKYKLRTCYLILNGHGFAISKTYPVSRPEEEALLDRIVDAIEFLETDPDAAKIAAAAVEAPLTQTRTSKKKTLQLHFPDAFAYTPVGDTFARISRGTPDEGLAVGLVDNPISQDRRELARVVEAAEKHQFSEVKLVKNDPKDSWEGVPAVHIETEVRAEASGPWYSRHAWYMIRDRRGCVITLLYPKAQPQEFKVLDRIARATTFAKPGKTLLRGIDEPESE